MNKRSTKFYRKNESEAMKRLGFKPTKNSGAGWIEKADGQNNKYICELKSTDKASFTIKQQVLKELEYHAGVSHKIPVFAFQFLNTDDIWVAIKEEEFREYMEFKKQQEEKEICCEIDLALDKPDRTEYNVNVQGKNVGKTYLARQQYREQMEKEKEQQQEDFKNRMKERRKQKFGKEVQTKRDCNI